MVEGEHDRSVLELYHGPALRRARIQVLAMRGAERAEASLTGLEALSPLGIPFFYLLDNGRRERQLAEHLRRHRHDEGVDVEIQPYPDIICVLPMEAVRRVAANHGLTPRPEISWRSFIAMHEAHPARSIKTRVKDKLGLKNLSVPDFVEELLKAAEDCGPADKGLDRIVESILARVGGRSWTLPNGAFDA